MTNQVIGLLGKNGFPGVEFHIPVDPRTRAIFCEGRGRAIALSETLGNRFGLKTAIGNECQIFEGTEKRSPIKAFPVIVSGLTHNNSLNISTKDPIVAAGLEALLDDKHIHSHATILPINNSKRGTGGSRNGNGNGK